MQPILLSAQIRAIEAEYLPDHPLMERAGQAAAEIAWQLLQQRPGKVLIMCGTGNNAGDGLVVARELARQGCQITLLGDEHATLPPDAQHAKSTCGPWLGQQIQWIAHWPNPQPWDLAVDALFGIGLNKAIEGRYALWISQFNQQECPRLALDIPSGLHADHGLAFPVAVQATHTATFIASKPGLHMLDGKDLCGTISVHDLGITIDHHLTDQGELLSPEHFLSQLTPRKHHSHKGSYGDAVIVGGAAGMLGALWLAGRAALSLGAGRVFISPVATDAPGIDPLTPELMCRPLNALPTQPQALAIGPGLGQQEEGLRALQIGLESTAPLILDADALNLLARSSELQQAVQQRVAPTLLTPHPLEAARLLGCDTATVQHQRVQAASELAQRFNAYVVLKGAGSVIATAHGQWWINPTGNPALATAGSGDVLTGIVCSLLAQGVLPLAALQAAVWLHGTAGDAWADREKGFTGLHASELIPLARAGLNQLIYSQQHTTR